MATISLTGSAVLRRQPRSSASRLNLITRLARRLAAARQWRADRDIAEILQRRGGVMARTKPGPGTAFPQREAAYPFRALPALQPR